MDTLSPAPLRDFAIIVDARDNVAVAKTEVPAGLAVALGERAVTVRGVVTPGNRFATRDIPAGEFVRQYGQPIGTSRGIAEGDPVTPANMSNDVPVVRDLDPQLSTPPPGYVPEAERRHVPRVPSPRRPRRHAQLHADRADQHVREPRGDADCDDRGVHRVLARALPATSTASSRSRTTRAAAAPTAAPSR